MAPPVKHRTTQVRAQLGDNTNGGCGLVQYRRSMSDEFVTYRASHAFVWIGGLFALCIAWSVGALFVIGRNAAGIAFALFGVAIGVVDLLYPFEATLDRHNLLVFRSIIRTRSFYVEDLRHVKYHRDEGEGGVNYWKFSFTSGSARLRGSPGERLALRLLELQPNIANDAANDRFLFDR